MDLPIFLEPSVAMTTIGTVASVGSAIFTLYQTKRAREASQSARAAMTSVQLAAVSERLRSAQEHIRDISPQKSSARGFKWSPKIDAIRKEFDNVLSALPSAGPGKGAREILSRAQNHLNKYESSLGTKADSSEWQMLQSDVQDAVSELVAEASKQGDQT